MDTNIKRDAAAARALDALRRLVHALQASSRVVSRPLGVTGAQLLVLRQVAGAPGCAVGDVARATLADPSTVSVVVRRLVRRGLLRRQVDDRDRRRVTLALSSRGAALVRRAPPAPQERLLDAIRRLPAQRREQMADALERLVRAAGFASEPPVMFLERGARRRSRAN